MLSSILIIIIIQNACLSKLNGEDQNHEILHKCLSKIITSNSQENELIWIFSNRSMPFYNTQLLRNLESTKLNYKTQLWFKIHFYVIDFATIEVLEVILKQLFERQALEQEQKYVLVANSFGIDIRHVVDVVWEYSIHNFVIVMQQRDNIDYGLWIWRPYLKSCPNSSTVFKVGDCGANTNLFENAGILKNLNGCVITAAVTVWPPYIMQPEIENRFTEGLEIRILNTLARSTNFTPRYVTKHNLTGWAEDFEEKDNNFRFLHERRTDLLFSDMFMSHWRYYHFTCTRSYFQGYTGFCVPTAAKKPQYKKWFQVIAMYGYLFGGLIIILPVFHVLRGRANLGRTLLEAVAVMCGHSLHAVPANWNLRWILMLWLFFTLHMNMVYQSKLTSVMQKPLFEHQIATIDELAASQLELLIMPHHARHIVNKTLKSYQIIAERAEFCLDIAACIKDMIEKRNSAVCVSAAYINYNGYQHQEGAAEFHCLDEHLSTGPNVMLINRNFILRDAFNVLIERLYEFGVINKWAADLGIFKAQAKRADDFEKVALNLNNLKLVFYCYVILIAMACLIFSVELIKYF